jgi:two-component system heavy metal sensor histidine kinase CusS
MSWKSGHESSSSERGPAPSPGPRTWSLAARLTAWYGLSAFALLAAATAFLYWTLVGNLDREDDEFLADKIHLLQARLQEQPPDPRLIREEVEWEPAARRYAVVYVRILDGAGATRFETPQMAEILPPGLFPPAGVDRPATESATELHLSSGRSFRVLAAPVAGSSDKGVGSSRTDKIGAELDGRKLPTPLSGQAAVIQIALDRTREEDLLADYRRSLWLALAAALVVCLLVGHQIARRGLRPVSAISAAAERIRCTTLQERIATVHLPAELAGLAEKFNEMLDRLQQSFDRLARFSADIAHELRTPINNLRGEAEVALAQPRSGQEYRDVLSSGLEECLRLSRLIDNLLFLARSEDPHTRIAREPVAVGQELARLRDYYEAPAAEAGVHLVAQTPREITAQLDRALFQRAVGNLVANALDHTPPGGSVILSAVADNGALRVTVGDTGPGIPPEHLPHVFDRFYRADPARSSASDRVGLGLAIVQTIAHLHGGSAEIDSQVGNGTRVTLVLPAS